MNNCEHCEFFKDCFGNYVECVKLCRFVDYEYWNNLEVEDCPLKNADLSETLSQNEDVA